MTISKTVHQTSPLLSVDFLTKAATEIWIEANRECFSSSLIRPKIVVSSRLKIAHPNTGTDCGCCDKDFEKDPLVYLSVVNNECIIHVSDQVNSHRLLEVGIVHCMVHQKQFQRFGLQAMLNIGHGPIFLESMRAVSEYNRIILGSKLDCGISTRTTHLGPPDLNLIYRP